MGLNSSDLITRIVDHALRLGKFSAVNGDTSPIAPPSSVAPSVGVWADSIDPLPAGSGLAHTSVVVLIYVRIYSSVANLPAEGIDTETMAAADTLMEAYSGDFDLGGTVRCIDLLGISGSRLGGKAGYVRWGDGTTCRVWTITVPIIVNDVWEQK